LKDIQILIADDEPFVTRSLSYVFQREGLSFETASDGEEALVKAQTLHPKILFLDIMMPKKTGHDVCAQLKSDPRYQSTYIIMLTAKGQEEDKTKSLSMGANEYIAKPFSPQYIVKHVKEILKKQP
jgi:two-component system, OmpR family, alkaline phosphatase synthesis response regulator PhoP